MKLFLIRHGQTDANLNKYYAGQTDVPLTEQGRQEAQAIRPVLEKFTFDRVYSSDLSRTVDTQKLALPAHTAIQTPLLREFDVGAMAGRYIADVIAEYGTEIRKTRSYVAFGGEDAAMVCVRMRKFLDELEAYPCEYVAAFVHNGIMNSMLQLVLNADYDRSATFTRNCAINVFEFDGTKWKLLAWNYMGTV